VNRVTADSNIYISAFLRGGKPLELLEMARAGQSELAVTEDILNEIGRVLGTRFRVPGEDVQAFREEILTFAKLVTPGEFLDAVPADPTDNRILECAVAAGSEVIVSGDKHLLGLGNFRGIEIVSVGEFLQHGPSRQR
jgi:putative PIN family toxin of toxin-antitoxin system